MDATEIDVPHYFLCPISLQIMKDPVTLPTGITYDRDSIERWLSDGKNKTCPITKQPLPSSEDALTPNIILRRLIQSWCTLNASHGFERIPTPKPPVTRSQISKIVKSGLNSSPQKQIECIRQLKSLAKESDANRRCIESAGAVDFLASVVEKDASFDSDSNCSPCEEALSLLHGLRIAEPMQKALVNENNNQFVDSLTRVMQRGSYESRAYAVLISKSIFEAADPLRKIGLRAGFFLELVQLVKDQISKQASKAALVLLVELCPWGRNRIKAVESGAVAVLIDLLLDSSERRPCEMAMTALDVLCQCAEGRAELVKHAAGMAVVSKKILRVSSATTESAVRIFLSIGKSSANPAVVQEMLQIGVVAKLCLVLQVESSYRAKEKAREVLRLHARVWKNSPCIPASLLCSYPGRDH
ncbi:E3 ubiquitin-protein ligase PUB23 [Linum perenne]